MGFLAFDIFVRLASLIIIITTAILTIHTTKKHFRLIRTSSYIERMNAPGMQEIRSEVNKWARSEDSDCKKLDALEKNHKLQAQLTIFFDIITELGIAYKYNVVDRDMVRDTWSPFIPIYWGRLQFYIYGERVRGHRVGYYFKLLADDIIAHDAEMEPEYKRRYAYPPTYQSRNITRNTIELKKTSSDDSRGSTPGSAEI